MYLVLSKAIGQPIAAFAASLDAAALSNAFSQLDSANVGLTIPKWEYSYSIVNMRPELTKLGMGIAFEKADFSNMYPGGSASISQVAHKTYIKVSEEGTQAAAATAVIVELLASNGPNRSAIVADHPFVYLITEKQTGTIVFLGIVNDPSKR